MPFRIEVKEFKEKGNDEYTLIYKLSNDHHNQSNHPDYGLSEYIVHIRFGKNCVSNLIQSKNIEEEYQKYLEAIAYLKERIKASAIIEFGLKAGTGFHKIPGKLDEFQADNLALSKSDIGGLIIVYAIHSDLGSGHCDRE